MALKRFKSLAATQDQFKGLDRTFSQKKLAYGYNEGADENLVWYYIERDPSSPLNTTDLQNLLMSFGLARESDSLQEDLNRAFGFTDWYDASTILVAEIPQSGCGSYIDGSTLEINVPTGNSASDFVTFYGATFKGVRDNVTGRDISVPYEGPGVYSGVYCYLFPNTSGPSSINPVTHGEHPYTGTIDGSEHPNAGLNSWTSANLDNKTFYPHLRATQWTRNPDSGRDIPYGIALLEQGLFILFDISNRTPFVESYVSANTIWDTSSGANTITISGGTPESNIGQYSRRAVVFTGNAAPIARVTYRTVEEDYKLVYFCHAAQNEFNSTTNHSYDHRKAFFRPEEADDIYITEIGLYDDNNELLAYAKLSEPVVKNQLETLTFKVELNIGND